MSIAPSFAGKGRCLIGAGALTLAVAMVPTLAKADCGVDLNALMSKRMSDVAALNQNTKSHGGKLDPISACPRLRSLAAAEGAVLAYMTKNKEWCGIPDDVISKMTDSRSRSVKFSAQACDIAVKMKKAQAQQAQAGAAGVQQQQAIKLPAGPL